MDAPGELRAFHGYYVYRKLPDVPIKTVADSLDDVYDGDLDDGDWMVTYLKSIPMGTIASRSRNNRECFCRIQKVRQEAGAEAPTNLL